MYRESEKTKQKDIWLDSGLMMGKRTREIFEDSKGWHNRFRLEITNRVEEEIFKPLFSNGTGAPNAPIRILVAMMALKEGQGISDEQLYEQARFNALIRSALGMLNSDEEVPTESTYYLFRQKISEYAEASGINLLEEAFERITNGQCKEYDVSGKRIRMDSKLLGSNIRWYTRYEVVHETIRKYCAANVIKTNEGKLGEILRVKTDLSTYRRTKEEVEQMFEELGLVMYRLVTASGAETNKEYGLLKRVFEEQYKVESGPGGGKKKRIKPVDKSEWSAKSVQNPHDIASEYRDKNGNKVKGYSLNVTETCVEGSLNLIVGIQAEGSGKSDVEHFQEGIEKAQKMVTGKIEEVYTDGGFHSPGNQEYCKEQGIDWTMGSIPGAPSKYDLSFDAEGNMVVVNKESGERLETRLVKSRKAETPQRWAIQDGDKRRVFEQKDVETCELRKQLEQVPKERLNVRNNVEATIFQLGYHYRADKSQYRGLMKHRMWAISRCLWVNFRRVLLWLERKTANRENNAAALPVKNFVINFLQNFFSQYRLFFCKPVFIGSN